MSRVKEIERPFSRAYIKLNRAWNKESRDANFAEWWVEDAPKRRGFRDDEGLRKVCRAAWDKGIEWSDYEGDPKSPEYEREMEMGVARFEALQRRVCREWYLSKYDRPMSPLVFDAFTASIGSI